MEKNWNAFEHSASADVAEELGLRPPCTEQVYFGERIVTCTWLEHKATTSQHNGTTHDDKGQTVQLTWYS